MKFFASDSSVKFSAAGLFCRRQLTAVLALLGIAVCFYGCGGPAASSSGSSGPDITADSASAEASAAGTTNSADFRSPVLRNAIHILANLEQFDQQLALDQVVDRLNQWVHLQKFERRLEAGSVHGFSTLPKRFAGDRVGRPIAG